MTKKHILGFPRIGANRELKRAVEAYWKKEITQDDLMQKGQKIEEKNWKIQFDQNASFITVGDFSYYDHILDTSAMLGVVPDRFEHVKGKNVDLDTIFTMGRGQAPNKKETTALAMKKWFNTNYHYMVPEFEQNQTFSLANTNLFNSIERAQKLNYNVKPVLVGPLTYLWLGKENTNFDKLSLLNSLLITYNQILEELKKRNITWIQIDEPILTLELPEVWQKAFISAYEQLKFNNLNALLATYFGDLGNNLDIVSKLPIHGLHIDLCSNNNQLTEIIQKFPHTKILSVGIVNGRNIWKTDLNKSLKLLKEIKPYFGENLWVATSCSLLHSPVDLDSELKLDNEIKGWLAFAKQKVAEVTILANGLANGDNTISNLLEENQLLLKSRSNSNRIHNNEVKQRIKDLTPALANRKNTFATRVKKQAEVLNLPLFPTTTIGSFPQTSEIRKIRQEFKNGKLDINTYTLKIREEIKETIHKQETLNLEVLVHGEAERNDMVEYFGELLNGFTFTSNGWVQSYGSRCVKPPVIYGDISRTKPMTIEWLEYAQSLTKVPVKGMLTGPVTILSWSFVRDDQPHKDTALQIALALRDEVTDLEKAGIKIIQIDEPAFREALPLKKKDWQNYLDWAVYSFKISSSSVADETQIHTHMCYSEFNDVIQSIAALDADVITLETSRGNMELLKAFEVFKYPNDIGPGVYDIHSPRIPTTAEIVEQLEKMLKYIPLNRLWVNPDCGLKTRNWREVQEALHNMVAAAKLLRQKYEKSSI